MGKNRRSAKKGSSTALAPRTRSQHRSQRVLNPAGDPPGGISSLPSHPFVLPADKAPPLGVGDRSLSDPPPINSPSPAPCIPIMSTTICPAPINHQSSIGGDRKICLTPVTPANPGLTSLPVCTSRSHSSSIREDSRPVSTTACK